MSRVFDVHRWYLSDEPRITAFRSAIDRVVRPGDVVVDIGAGTGILALMACVAGAARVYALERDPIIEIARKVARANGYQDRIEFLRGESSQLTLPEQADVVVSDLIGPFAFDAGIFDVLTDASARYLKPDGRTIPATIALYAAPVQVEELRATLGFWRRHPGGFDMTPAFEAARKTAHHAMVAEDALLTAAVLIGRYNCCTEELPCIEARATTRVARDGVIDAIAGWFDAELAPGVRITNAPGAAERLARRNLLLPVTEPIAVSAGAEVTLKLRVLTHDQVCRWTVERVDRAGGRLLFSGSTFEGLVLSREDLAQRDAVPIIR